MIRSSMNTSQQPILLIGTHRSGTTWLGRVLSTHSSLAYWIEPRHVWTWGHWFRDDDRLGAEDATDRVASHIRRRFAEFVSRQGKQRLLEKTPGNCLRVAFVRRVFPEASIIFLVRDGRAVISSNELQRQRLLSAATVRRRFGDTSPTEWVAHLGQVPRVFNKLLGRKARIWGPHPPGWKDWVRNDPAIVVAARQWASMIEHALSELATGESSSQLLLKYEDLLENPEKQLTRVAEVCDLGDPSGLIELARGSALSGTRDKWRCRLDDESLSKIRPILEPMLRRLEYKW